MQRLLSFHINRYSVKPTSCGSYEAVRGLIENYLIIGRLFTYSAPQTAISFLLSCLRPRMQLLLPGSADCFCASLIVHTLYKIRPSALSVICKLSQSYKALHTFFVGTCSTRVRSSYMSPCHSGTNSVVEPLLSLYVIMEAPDGAGKTAVPHW